MGCVNCSDRDPDAYLGWYDLPVIAINSRPIGLIQLILGIVHAPFKFISCNTSWVPLLVGLLSSVEAREHPPLLKQLLHWYLAIGLLHEARWFAHSSFLGSIAQYIVTPQK